MLSGENKTFLFKRGEEYRGAINIPFGVNNISFGAYGTGARPVIKNSEEVTSGWSVHNGNIYKASVAIPTNSKMIRLYNDGDLRTYARYPNSAWLRTDNVYNDPWRFTDAELTEDATNAEVVIRVSNWLYKRLPVSDHTNDVITVDGELDDVAVTQPGASSAEWGYFLCGKYDFLDADGEWYYDDGEGDLYYYSTSGPPTSIEYALQYVEGSLGAGITFNGTVGGTVEYLEFKHQTDAAVSISTASTITIQNCSFQDLSSGVAGDGGLLQVVGLHQVNECAFTRIYDNGIRLSSSGCTIDDNTFDDIALLPGERPNDFGGYGILADGDNATVTRNRLNNIGYSGIGNQGNGGLIENNSISNWLYTLNDGAAITFDNCTDLEVRNNIVHAPFFSTDPDAVISDRLESVSLVYTERTDITFGIYFGNRPAIGVVVENNVVYGCAAGIHVDHTTTSEDNIIRNNTLFNNDVQLNLLDHSNCMVLPGENPCLGVAVGPGIAYQGQYNTEYEGNILYCLNSAQVCMQQGHTYAGSHATLVNYGTFSNNYYFNPFTDIAVLQRMFYPVTGVTEYLGGSVIPHTLAGWQNPPATGPRDLGSTRSPLRLKDFDALGFTAIPNDGLSADMSGGDITAWTSGSFSSEVCNDCEQGGHALSALDQNWIEQGGSRMWIGPIVPADLLGFDVVDIIDVENTYHFTFRMRSPDTDAIRFGPIYQDGSYRQYQYLGLSPEWRSYEMVFNVSDNAVFDYMVSGFQNVQYSLGMLDGSVVELDFIEAKACTLNTAYAQDVIAEEHILRYNCPLTAVGGQNAGASFTVPGTTGQCWSDVYGNFYAAGDNYPLDPWKSVVLFRMDVPVSDLVFTNGVHTVSGNVTINTNQNIAGSIVVPSGATLTIDGAHIGFVASTPQLTTNLTVQPGGTLVLKNGATLRNWMGCDAPAAMWDGVQAGAMIGQTGHPRIDVLSGSTIMNAHTALFFAKGDPKNPIGTASSGSEPRFTIRDSNFRNNVFDVFISPSPAVAGGVLLHRSSIERTNFVTTSVLTDPTLKPKDHIHMRYVRDLPIKASVFANTSGLDASTPTHWGNGIVALNSSPHVTHEGVDRSKFNNLHYGIRAETTFSNMALRVEQTDFTGCAAGLYVAGHRNTRSTENTFTVPDLDVRFKGVAATYGSYLVGCSGFELEENVYRGVNGTEHPKVGAVFYQTGLENNEYYRNRFDNFRDDSGASVGTLIMGNNGGTAPESGLHFRCNNYSNEQLNDHDIALTGSTITIGSEQGVNMNEFTLAGNTFANFAGTDCGGNDERHLFVDLAGSNSLNVFQYWHHAEETAVEFRPHCDSYPIVVNEDPVVDWIKATNYFYVDEACPQSLSNTRTYSDAIEELLEVEAQYKLLKAVYSDWSDGGDTEGLRDYILDPQNNSFAVRNQLMLLAPKVSHANWELAFARTPAMDPWHLAQALVANSPLTLQTMVLLDSSMVNPYYKQLITEAQSGISMHSIYQGELAHLYGRQARTTYDVVAKALVDSLPAKVDSTLMILEGMLLQGREQLQVALHLSKSELGQARIALDSMHTKDPEDGYWKVQDLAFSLLEEEKSLEEIDAAGIALLEDVVATEKEGLAEALSWLKMLGQEYTELLILPTQSKRGRPHAPSKPEHHWSPLLVYPNPSNGPVNIVYEVPDAVERAELRVMNALGQLVIQKSISSRGILVLELPRTASGLHVAGLFFDGHLMATEKLNIIR